MHQLIIATSLQLLLPVLQTIFFSVPRFSICRGKNPQKLNVIFLDQNRRNYRLYGNYIWWDQFFIIYYKAKHSLICYFHVNMVCIADRRTYKIIRDFKICNVCWFQTGIGPKIRTTNTNTCNITSKFKEVLLLVDVRLFKK